MPIELPALSDLLASLLAGSSGKPVLFHTDITRFGVPEGCTTKIQALDAYSDMLERVCASRVLVFPTFNYDFCRTGIYDVELDRCQVGTLNEFYRAHRARSRTLTPVFNFCSSAPDRPPVNYSLNPFDETSTFAWLRQEEAEVVFLGAPFTSNTFVHHVEELANVGYRYLKPFHGVIRNGDLRVPLTLEYRVRPLREGVVEYDWDRLSTDLRDAGILRSRTIGKTVVHAYPAEALVNYWLDRIGTRETYLLTEPSVLAVELLARSVGYPFSYSALEQTAGT